MLKSKTIGLITAGAIALTAVMATPVMAKNNKDRLGIAVGALGLIYLLHEANKKDRRERAVVDKPRDKVKKPRRDRKDRRRAHNKRHVPEHCLRQKWTNHGWKTFYGRKCLRRHGIDPNRRGLHHH